MCHTVLSCQRTICEHFLKEVEHVDSEHPGTPRDSVQVVVKQ